MTDVFNYKNTKYKLKIHYIQVVFNYKLQNRYLYNLLRLKIIIYGNVLVFIRGVNIFNYEN